MTRFYQITIAVLLVYLIVSRLSSCQESLQIVEKTRIEFVRVPYDVEKPSDTVTRDRIVYKPVFFNGNEIHDTIYRDGKPVAISPEEYCSKNLNFTAQSSRQIFKSGDSLTAKFSYPIMVFDFDFHPKTDTNIVVTKTIVEKQNPFGLFFGVGAVMGLDGTIRGGIHAGIGIRIY